MKKISAIYSIVHIQTNRCYIGSAVNIAKRLVRHRWDLNLNRHDNKYLQNAWNRYGEKAFEFKLVEEISDLNNLLIREQYWLDYYKSYERDKGFNIRQVATSNFGLEHTQETREKIRQGHLNNPQDQKGYNNPFFGRIHSDEAKKKMRTPRSEEFRKIMSLVAKKREAEKRKIK